MVVLGLPPRCPQVVWCHRDWAITATLVQNRLSECDQPRKNPLKYIAMTGNWTRAMERTDKEIHSFFHWAIMNPGYWVDRQWDTFVLPLSYHEPGPWRGQTVRYIHFSTELSWLGLWRAQTVRYIHSSTELSWTRSMERTDSEIHSFSHWAIMTWDTERTDSEIHSFFHWAIIIDFRVSESQESQKGEKSEMFWSRGYLYKVWPTSLSVCLSGFFATARSHTQWELITSVFGYRR